MFASANFVGPLPPPAPGHYRALRVEAVGDSRVGACFIYGHEWHDLPTPYAEGQDIEKHQVCATWPETFEEWFPGIDAVKLNADKTTPRHVVVLDVPVSSTVALDKQLLINRNTAKVVAVLLH